jgi:guanylate kinase
MSSVFIITGPAGAGEDSVIKELGKRIDFEKVVTTTSRPMRPEDKEGVSYYFISKEEFEKKIEKNEFFEFALEDNGNYYGGTYEELERVRAAEKPVIWKIDFKGAIAAKTLLPEAKSIYLSIPPELIEKRLRARGESEDVIKSRIEYSRGWYDNEAIFDFKVKNREGKLDETVEKVAEIIKSNADAESS